MFKFLEKRGVDIFLVITPENIYAVFNFKRPRKKMLKGQRLFCAKIFVGELSIQKFFDELRNWLETTTEDYLLERLDDSPNNSRPIINITPRIKIDFNVVEEEVATLISSQYLS
jgi:hypothetical protein